MELRFEGGASIAVHSVKLSLASCVLGDLIDDVMADQITLARSSMRKNDEGGLPPLPHVQVSIS